MRTLFFRLVFALLLIMTVLLKVGFAQDLTTSEKITLQDLALRSQSSVQIRGVDFNGTFDGEIPIYSIEITLNNESPGQLEVEIPWRQIFESPDPRYSHLILPWSYTFTVPVGAGRIVRLFAYNLQIKQFPVQSVIYTVGRQTTDPQLIQVLENVSQLEQPTLAGQLALWSEFTGLSFDEVVSQIDIDSASLEEQRLNTTKLLAVNTSIPDWLSILLAFSNVFSGVIVFIYILPRLMDIPQADLKCGSDEQTHKTDMLLLPANESSMSESYFFASYSGSRIFVKYPANKPGAEAQLKNEIRLHKLLPEVAGVPKFIRCGQTTSRDGEKDSSKSYYLVQEYIAGCTLKELLDKENYPLNRNAVIYFTLQLLKILKQIHHKKIIHQDIKPENLMIDCSGEIYLVDLGVAIKLGSRGNRRGGSKPYQAPEPLSLVSPRTDIYAIGVVFCELFFRNSDVPKGRVNGDEQKMVKVIRRCRRRIPYLRYRNLESLQKGIGYFNRDFREYWADLVKKHISSVTRVKKANGYLSDRGLPPIGCPGEGPGVENSASGAGRPNATAADTAHISTAQSPLLNRDGEQSERVKEDWQDD